MSAARLADVLATHEFMPCATHTPTVSAWWAQCEGCDWKRPRRTERASPTTDHRAHVEAAVLAWLAETIDNLPLLTEGPLRVGTQLWPECDRDAYSLAIEEAQGALRVALTGAQDADERAGASERGRG